MGENMGSIILAWDIKKMFEALEDIIDNKENVLINYYGLEQYNELLQINGGNVEEAKEWIKHILKSKIKSTEQLLEHISNETKDNNIVQKRLKAVNIVK